MNLLITTDIHCSDSPKDNYRLELFPWLRGQQDIHKVDATLILGDLTIQKNRHSATLVNSIVAGLKQLRPPVFIPKGNHDYEGNEDNPFFRFLNAIPGVKFFVNPAYVEEFNAYFVPHQTSQAALDKAFRAAPEGCLVFSHNTFTGAINEHGGALAGHTLPPHKAHAVYAGDVHVPQTIKTSNGNVTYIGSPFHIKFGDQFTPRILLRNNDKETNLYFPAPKKVSLTIRDLSEMPDLNKGDQVKITLELPRSEAVEWANHKQSILNYCKDRSIEVYGTELRLPEPRKRATLNDSKSRTKKSNLDYFLTFCANEKTPQQMKVTGLRIIEGDSK